MRSSEPLGSEIHDHSLIRFVSTVFEIVITVEELRGDRTPLIHDSEQAFFKHICCVVTKPK